MKIDIWIFAQQLRGSSWFNKKCSLGVCQRARQKEGVDFAGFCDLLASGWQLDRRPTSYAWAHFGAAGLVLCSFARRRLAAHTILGSGNGALHYLNGKIMLQIPPLWSWCEPTNLILAAHTLQPKNIGVPLDWRRARSNLVKFAARVCCMCGFTRSAHYLQSSQRGKDRQKFASAASGERRDVGSVAATNSIRPTKIMN